MSYETDLWQGLARINPAKDSDQAWAEQQLAELMRDCQLDREQALMLMKENAPTVYRWLQGSGWSTSKN